MKTSFFTISAFNSAGVIRRTLSSACKDGLGAGVFVAALAFSRELQPVSATIPTSTAAAIKLKRRMKPPKRAHFGSQPTRAEVDFVNQIITIRISRSDDTLHVTGQSI